MSALDKISDPLSDWKADMPQPTTNMAPSASPKFGITANKMIAPPTRTPPCSAVDGAVLSGVGQCHRGDHGADSGDGREQAEAAGAAIEQIGDDRRQKGLMREAEHHDTERHHQEPHQFGLRSGVADAFLQIFERPESRTNRGALGQGDRQAHAISESTADTQYTPAIPMTEMPIITPAAAGPTTRVT